MTISEIDTNVNKIKELANRDFSLKDKIHEEIISYYGGIENYMYLIRNINKGTRIDAVPQIKQMPFYEFLLHNDRYIDFNRNYYNDLLKNMYITLLYFRLYVVKRNTELVHGMAGIYNQTLEIIKFLDK